MKSWMLMWVLFPMLLAGAQSQDGVLLTTSDARLKETFDWAKRTALSYAHDGKDPVGHWYEAALGGREAFCLRDIAHQSIGGEILGLSPHNFNMMYKFALNISESKDWCTFWEINRHNKPAPVDYDDDKQFWYPLSATPDAVNACYRLYNWTGNKDYLYNPALSNFYEKSLTVYLDRWRLNPGELMSRPRDMNAELPFRQGGKFNGVRGFPSYVESQRQFTCGVDLIAALYAGCKAYGEMLSLRGEKEKAASFLAKAEMYKALINETWWNAGKNRFEPFLMPGGLFCNDEVDAIYGQTYVAWFGASSSPSRTRGILDYLRRCPSNIENRSHYPYMMYRYRSPETAYEVLLSLKGMERSGYPEVSFAVVEGVVAGLMGVRPSGAKGVIQTLPQLSLTTEWAELRALPVLNTTAGVRHDGNKRSTFINAGFSAVRWQASFCGDFKTIKLNDRETAADSAVDEMGNPYSFVEVEVLPGKTVTAFIP